MGTLLPFFNSAVAEENASGNVHDLLLLLVVLVCIKILADIVVLVWLLKKRPESGPARTRTSSSGSSQTTSGDTESQGLTSGVAHSGILGHEPPPLPGHQMGNAAGNPQQESGHRSSGDTSVRDHAPSVTGERESDVTSFPACPVCRSRNRRNQDQKVYRNGQPGHWRCINGHEFCS